jgi:hypothetical protein
MWLLIADESVSLTGYVDCILVWVISTLAKLTFHYSKKNKKTEKKKSNEGGKCAPSQKHVQIRIHR